MQKILSKLHAIMSEVDFIEKDKTNEHFHYSYASELAIKQAIQPLLIKHKIIFQVEITDATTVGSLTTIKVKYWFRDIESAEVLEGFFAGLGQDSQDKGVWKALTGAIKYILTSTFLIPTGDDPEAESKNTDNPKPNISAYETAKAVMVPMDCPNCGGGKIVNMKGISKKTGKPYDFDKCEECRTIINK